MVGEKTCSEWVQDREETALGTESKIILNGFLLLIISFFGAEGLYFFKILTKPYETSIPIPQMDNWNSGK